MEKIYNRVENKNLSRTKAFIIETEQKPTEERQSSTAGISCAANFLKEEKVLTDDPVAVSEYNEISVFSYSDRLSVVSWCAYSQCACNSTQQACFIVLS